MSDQPIKNSSASKVFSACLSSTPILFLLIETQLCQLKITIKHQALSCFERAMRHLSQNHLISAPLAQNQ